MATVAGTRPIRTRKRAARIATTVALAVIPLSVAAGELRVTVEGIRSPRGMVLIGLHDSMVSFERAIASSDEESFLIDPDCFGAVALRANAALKSTVMFSNLDPGRYAAIVFHDENGNGKLDKNFLRVPSEPYGFSNNVQGFLSAPSFDAAAMAVGEGNQVIRIALVHEGSR